MNTVDTVDKVPKKRGRPAKKQDKATPLGEYIAEEAKLARKAKSENKIVEKYYELCGPKLSLCKRTARGSIYKTFVGSVTDKKDGPKLRDYIAKLQAEGRLRTKI